MTISIVPTDARIKELCGLMRERFSMNPVSGKILNEEWKASFPSEPDIAKTMLSLLARTTKAEAELLAVNKAQPVRYLNKFSGACVTLEQQPNAADDEAVYAPLFTIPHVPIYPEKLPCAVHLLPGLKFGTGIATKTLLEALARREKYNLDISAMTVVERAEHFAKTMRPQSDHLNSAIKLAEEASKLADRIREEELTPPSVQTDELVMQIRRLVHSLKKAKPDSLLVQQVTEYMKRHGYFKATDCLRGEVEGKN